MPEAALDALLNRVVERLLHTRRLVVYTGAGMSKESGIATFREAEEGLWAQYDPTEMATREGFLRNPELVWRWYEHRFAAIESAQPNAGHLAVAELERYVPTVTVVTQNIDGLHQRAGSRDVVELHGTAHSFRCVDDRHRGFTLADLRDQSDVPPHCPACGALVRPEVVWFGEALPARALERAVELSARCDLMLVVGTSGVVYPAAMVPLTAAQRGAFVVDVNPERDELARVADVFLQGRGGDVLPAIVAALATTRDASS